MSEIIYWQETYEKDICAQILKGRVSSNDLQEIVLEMINTNRNITDEAIGYIRAATKVYKEWILSSTTSVPNEDDRGACGVDNNGRRRF